MKISEKYRPATLGGIVGQGCVRHLRTFAASPYENSFLLVGPPGVGKTTAALALANDLGCPDEYSGLTVEIASEFTIDRARELFEGRLRMRPLYGSDWKVLVIEELESLHPKAETFLKVALETKMPPKLVVVATSNDPSNLGKALLQRFKRLSFDGCAAFETAARSHLASVWEAETGKPDLPAGISGWDGATYSMRLALDRLQYSLVAA